MSLAPVRPKAQWDSIANRSTYQAAAVYPGSGSPSTICELSMQGSLNPVTLLAGKDLCCVLQSADHSPLVRSRPTS